jgi:predicted NUDIX family NTP pyrophosphohydrolase
MYLFSTPCSATMTGPKGSRFSKSTACASDHCLAAAIEGDIDAAKIRSNTFSLEWPPGSGKVRDFPEVDRARWFDIATAREKIQ